MNRALFSCYSHGGMPTKLTHHSSFDWSDVYRVIALLRVGCGVKREPPLPHVA